METINNPPPQTRGQSEPVLGNIYVLAGSIKEPGGGRLDETRQLEESKTTGIRDVSSSRSESPQAVVCNF